MRMKKLICMLLSFALILGCCVFPAFAEQNSTENIEIKVDSKELILLKTLGFIEPDMAPDKIITRTDLAQILAVFTGYVDKGYESRHSLKYKPAVGKMTQYDYQRIEGKPIFEDVPETHWAVGYIEDVALKGIMRGSDENKYIFNPEDKASYYDVYKTMVNLLGYAPMLEIMGENYEANVMKCANESDIVPRNAGDMTTDILAKIIFATLEAEVLEISTLSSNGNATYTKERKYMECAFDLYSAEDVFIEANNVARLYDGQNALSETLIADGIEYIDSNNIGFEFLGDNCDIYYELDENTDSKNIKAIIVNSEVEAEVDRDNIISLEQGLLSYYGNKDRIKKLNLSANIDVIYNYQFWNGWTYDQLLIPDAKYVFVDTDDDGNVDLIRLFDYEYLIVDSVQERTKTIRSSMQFASGSKGLNELCLDGDKLKKEILVSIIADGSKKEFTDIANGMLLAILRGKGTSSGDEKSIVVEILDSGKTIRVDGLSKEPGIVIDEDIYPDCVNVGGYEYKIDDDFYSGSTALKLSDIGKAYITKNEKIIAFIKMSNATNQYGFLKRIAISDEAFDEVFVFKIFTEDGTWITFESEEKIKVNGSRGKTGKMLANNGIITLSGDNEILSVTPQLIRYTYEDKVLKSLDTVQKDLTGYTDADELYNETRRAITEDKFRLSNYGTDFRYLGSLKTLSWRINLRNPCPVFFIPQNAAEASTDDFAVRSSDKSFAYNTATTVWSYDEDLFGSPKVLVIDAGDGATGATPTNKLFLVSDMCHAVDSYGDVGIMVRGFYEGDESEFFLKDSMINRIGENTIKRDFEDGNILKIALSVDNRIENYTVVYSPQTNGYYTQEGEYLKVSSCIGSAPIQYAKVQSIDRNTKMYRLYGSVENDGDYPYRNIWFSRGDSQWVAIYDGEARRGHCITISNISEIEEGDYLVTRYQDNVAYATVVYRNVFN